MAAAGLPLPQDLAAWLIWGIDLFESGQCKTLCRALGLRRPGHAAPATLEKLHCRNACLVNIAKLYPAGPWQQATTIEKRLKRYPYLPPEEKPLYGYLLSLNTKIPGRDGIYKILIKELN